MTTTMNQTSLTSSGWCRQVPCLLSGAMSPAQKCVVGQKGTILRKGTFSPSVYLVQPGTPREMGF